MAIYSLKCVECKEVSKKEIKKYERTGKGGRKYIGSMYECNNENCAINITRKRRLREYANCPVHYNENRNDFQK